MGMRTVSESINDRSLGEFDFHDHGVTTGLDGHEPGAFPGVGDFPARQRRYLDEVAGIDFGIAVGIVTGLQTILAGR
jgi:hypothetical protein